MKNKTPKFTIGQQVVNKVPRKGSAEPSICNKYAILIVDGVCRLDGGSFQYTCGYDGYQFLEDELMSIEEYKQLL